MKRTALVGLFALAVVSLTAGCSATTPGPTPSMPATGPYISTQFPGCIPSWAMKVSIGPNQAALYVSNLLRVPIPFNVEPPATGTYPSEWRLYPALDDPPVAPPAEVTQYAVPWHGVSDMPRLLINGEPRYFSGAMPVPMLGQIGPIWFGIGLAYADFGDVIVVEPMLFGLRLCDGPLTITRPA